MSILPLIGHTRTRIRLAEAEARGTLPASLLLHGPRGVGKQRLALWLAQRRLCSAEGERPCDACQSCRFVDTLSHPDLHWFFPRPRLKDSDPSVSDIKEDYGEAVAERAAAGGLYAPSAGDEGLFVATIRAIVQVAALSPAISRRKVFVIGDAERMVPQEGSEYAANAFLKLLEEPPADTTIVLTSSEPGALLPTIRSRLVAVQVPTLPESDVREFLAHPAVRAWTSSFAGATDEAELVRFASGAPGRVLAYEHWRQALDAARRFLDAAAKRNAAGRLKLAMSQGGSGARGRFSDTLEALTLLLHERARQAAEHRDDARAAGIARLIASIEETKERAAGNVNPQLLSASLLRELEALAP